MPSKHSVRVSIDINAPQAAVWARVSEHEETRNWIPAVKRVTLTRVGEQRNGLGAVRVVEFKQRLWSAIHERIVRFEAPQAFDYVLFKGMPALMSHLGNVRVDDLGDDRSRLTWNVDFVFRSLHPFAPLIPSTMRQFHQILADGIATLKRQMESDPDRSVIEP